MKLLCAIAVVAAVGCGSFIDRQAASSTYRILSTSMQVARRQADLELAREAMPGGLYQLAAFAAAYPDHAGFRALYAETLCQYMAGFVFDDWDDAKLSGRGADAARIAERLGTLGAMCVDANLALLPPAWRAARDRDGEAMGRLIAAAGRDAVPAMLWIATADTVTLAIEPLRGLVRLGVIRAALERCVALAPGFHDGDAELLLATLVSAQSQLLGGDDGSAAFARAAERAGAGALIVEVLFARGVAVARKDRALLETTLAKVLAADVTQWPERRLSNELARRKARRYLAAAATLVP